MKIFIQAQDGRYYNGRAADWNGNLTRDVKKAFDYGSMEAAQHKANLFNMNTRSSFNFTVVKYLDN